LFSRFKIIYFLNPLKDLAAHIDELKAEGAVKFTAEYESIEPGQQFTWDNSSMDVNKPKNRRANMQFVLYIATIIKKKHNRRSAVRYCTY
jgi:hypothetical protein